MTDEVATVWHSFFAVVCCSCCPWSLLYPTAASEPLHLLSHLGLPQTASRRNSFVESSYTGLKLSYLGEIVAIFSGCNGCNGRCHSGIDSLSDSQKPDQGSSRSQTHRPHRAPPDVPKSFSHYKPPLTRIRSQMYPDSPGVFS